jgi:hypothetical protein
MGEQSVAHGAAGRAVLKWKVVRRGPVNGGVRRLRKLVDYANRNHQLRTCAFSIQFNLPLERSVWKNRHQKGSLLSLVLGFSPSF